jgi:hypothetical protein
VGKEVDWDEYKKSRPQDRLNYDNLKIVEKLVHQNVLAASMKLPT